MKVKLKTAKAHDDHYMPCGCATTIGEAKWACKKCGAMYTDDLESFISFWCYDCRANFGYKRVTP